MDGKRNITGSVTTIFRIKTKTTDCNASLYNNAGCGVISGPGVFGKVFNAVGGGVMAVEWRNEGIRIW